MKTFNFMIILVSLLALCLLNFVDFVSCQDPAAGAPAPAPAPGTPAPGTPAPAPGTPAPAPGAPAAPGGLIPTTIGTITKEPDLSAVPQSLLVPKGNNFAFLLNARGNQIYQCSAKQWFLTDSDSMLINDKSDLQQHFDPAFNVVHQNITKTPIQGGNYTWNSLLPSDSSQVVAKLVQSVDAQDPKNIPWELYAATFRSDSGKFSNTSYILRINTNGGVAPPADQCGVQYLDGSSNSVSYEADYLFYEGVLPGTPTNQPSQPSESPSTSKTNDGYSTKPIGPGKLSWVAIVGFISVGVISF